MVEENSMGSTQAKLEYRLLALELGSYLLFVPKASLINYLLEFN